MFAVPAQTSRVCPVQMPFPSFITNNMTTEHNHENKSPKRSEMKHLTKSALQKIKFYFL